MSNAPCELEFLAENDTIRIMPNFNLKELLLISGPIGPFRAGLPITVPLWLAINLRQRSKCRILVPDWLDVPTLTRVKDEELRDENFTPMPSDHYMILGKILLELCSGEVANTDELRTLLKDIWDIRTSKFKNSIASFLESGRCHAKVNNLTQMEISSVRPFFPHALEQIFLLTRDLNNALSTSKTKAVPTGHDSQSSMTSTSASNSMAMEVDSQVTEDSQSQR